MKEVQEELSNTCAFVKNKSDYYYVDFCFLEVLPPYIKEGLRKCIEKGVDSITVVPLFLYPGMKLKDAVTQTSSLIIKEKIKSVIAKPLSYQPVIPEIVYQRINSIVKEKTFEFSTNFSILLIGHGSSDRRARDAFLFTVNSLKRYYKNVTYCFLELEPPNIDEGIRESLTFKPDSIVVVPYFLHNGVHIQKDILIDINKALEKYQFDNLVITKHIGVEPSIIDLILNLAQEAEKKSGLFQIPNR